MTQSSHLGAIANQPGAVFRSHVNIDVQSLATNHYGATQPPVVYANMIWFSSGDGFIKVRNPTNTGWQNIGTIGPPLKWTNVDLPQENFVTGDVKQSYSPSQPTGWQHMNDGTIGGPLSGANARPNDDAWPLFSLLWGIAGDDWCTVYQAGTFTRTGRGSSALADWNAARHMRLPAALGRVMCSAGQGVGLSSWGIATWTGQEFVQLIDANMPSHNHGYTVNLPAHNHNLARALPNYIGGKGSSSGSFTLADQSSGVTWTEVGGGGSAGGATDFRGGNTPHFNIQPETFVHFFIKL